MIGMLNCQHYFAVLTGKTKDRVPGLAKEELFETIFLCKEYLMLEAICHEFVDFYEEIRVEDCDDNVAIKRRSLEGIYVFGSALAQITQVDPANAVPRSPKIWKQLLLERDPISEIIRDLRYEDEGVPESAWRDYVYYVTCLLRIFEDKDLGKTIYGQYARMFYLNHGPQLMRALVKVFEKSKNHLPYHGLLHRVAELEVFAKAFQNEKPEALDLFLSPIEEFGIVKLCIWKFNIGDVSFLDFPRALLRNPRTCHIVEELYFYDNLIYWIFEHNEFGKSRLTANVLIQQLAMHVPPTSYRESAANKTWFISFRKLVNSVPPYVFDFLIFECFCEDRRERAKKNYTSGDMFAPLFLWLRLKYFGAKLNKNLVGCILAELAIPFKMSRNVVPSNLALPGDILNLPEDSKYLAAGVAHAVVNPPVKDDDIRVVLDRLVVPNGKTYTSKEQAQYFYEEMSCAECLKPSKDLSCCSKCKMTHYCSKECQVAGWTLHKRLCHSLSTMNLVVTKEKTVDEPFKRKQDRFAVFKQAWKNTDPAIFPLAEIFKTMPDPPIDVSPSMVLDNSFKNIGINLGDEDFKSSKVEDKTTPESTVAKMVLRAMANQINMLDPAKPPPSPAPTLSRPPPVPLDSSGGASSSSAQASPICKHCGKAGARMTCGRCHKAKYCDRNCQAAHWSTHKSECRA